ncbi:hypothetical protein SEA_PINKYOSHI_44 [Mycobacterium phage PinkYoshi]|uniref:Uncharacterized protein n=3 Tax=Mycobacterium virus Halo TaxID=373407 RepID=Q1A0N5_9CAUD|nr:hypothetical protein ANGEL_44 [Mycobacterium phage Angel]YP_655561.2 hypothetical protein Halo44 [Mycobacterium phage Halo]ACB58203.1 hypothetical protein BPs1_44 [Mycobacterium phage BPs]ACU41508.1 hypothetical protein HOPE_44 [Mycobacterium phage Hope]AER48499.1 hypothetical protein AVRAFAN_44 [Mycobacterium phage Avrafan]AKY02648.1 hypothetical protein SEA_PHREAK_44 [Mycobacterium phage Phreak]ALF00825.1 hypothetical protein SEA_FROSTY24_44 [Mycobacterium phage Frosty24]ANS06286.1 hypo
MGLIQDQPEDLPTTNALDAIVDPDEEQGGERAEIYLSGAHVATLDNAPTGAGARVTLMVELEVVEEGHKYKENGDVEVPIRRCKRIGDMWRPGTPKPPTKEEIAAQQAAAKAKAAAEEAAREEAERAEQEHNEPPMFDEDGEPISDDAPRPPDDDEADPNTQFDVDEDQDVGNVVQFSDGGK